MADFRIEDAAFSGVNLLVRKPFAALTWAGVYLVFLIAVVVPFAGALFGLVSTIAKSSNANSVPPAEILSGMGSLLGMFVLLALGGLVIGTVVSCAVIRAVLQPENSAFAYLRLGSEELWVMLVQFVRGILIAVVQAAMTIPVVIFTGITAAVTHSAGGPFVSLLGQLAVYAVVIWITLRLSLAGPITFTEKQFRLFESWTLTRGHTWRLLAVGILIGVVGLIVYFAAVFVGVIGGVAIWGSTPHPSNIQALLSQPPAQWAQALAPFVILFGALVFVAGALLTPITLAPWPYIYKQLNPGVDIAATFS